MDLQVKFHTNPLINPRTGRSIKENGSTYKALVKEFGLPTEQSVVKTPGTDIPKINIDELFDSKDLDLWEQTYKNVMNPKYQKNTRNFSTFITGRSVDNPNIYIIPRERGGPSYKNVQLELDNPDDIQFCPISKGFSMQDISSFTMGPIVGEGLCVVNYAFSKNITIAHIEGGGKVNIKRKNLWQRAKNPLREIIVVNDEEMIVNKKQYNIVEWLETNKELWWDEWNKLNKLIVMHKEGNFHWHDDTQTLCYYHKGFYLDFVEWKIECYIKPSYELFKNNRVMEFLDLLYNTHKVSLGLVHPKGRSGYAEKAIKKEFIRELFLSKDEMCCMPYVVAGYLLGVNI